MNDVVSVDCLAHLQYCFPRPFHCLQDDGEFKLEKIPHHYGPLTPDFDPDFEKNDWAIIASRAFVCFKRRFEKIESMLIIGTGIGLDALGALECFSPSQLVITDLSQRAVEGANFNIMKYVNKNIREHIVKAINSNLFANDFFHEKRFDLIFENLPNLPIHLFELSEQPMLGSFYPNEYPPIPRLYSQNLLMSHYQFLSEAKDYITANGGVICNIGARVPLEYILKMFADLGFTSEILVFDFKRQNETLVNVKAYAEWEKANNVEFKFYSYRNTSCALQHFTYEKMSGFSVSEMDSIYSAIDNYKLTATEAYERLISDPTDSVGHFFYSFYATYNR